MCAHEVARRTLSRLGRDNRSVQRASLRRQPERKLSSKDHSSMRSAERAHGASQRLPFLRARIVLDARTTQLHCDTASVRTHLRGMRLLQLRERQAQASPPSAADGIRLRCCGGVSAVVAAAAGAAQGTASAWRGRAARGRRRWCRSCSRGGNMSAAALRAWRNAVSTAAARAAAKAVASPRCGDRSGKQCWALRAQW